MKNLLKYENNLFSRYSFLLVAFGACVSNKQTQPSTDYTQLVNPFIGTDFTGNTYPGAQAPFGMVQLSPDNGLPGWDRISGYFYSGQYDCRIQSYPFVGDGSRRLV